MKIKAILTRVVLQELEVVIDAEVNDPNEFGIKTNSDLDKRLFGIDSKLKWKNIAIEDIGPVDFIKPNKNIKADIILSKEESEENKLPPGKALNMFNFIEPITVKMKPN